MSALARLALFTSSYAPLFAVFALLNSFGAGWPSQVCLVATAVGLVVLPLILLVTHKLAPQELKVETSQLRDGDVAAYVVTYLVPFAAAALTTKRERIALGLFIALVAILYVRGELFYINPLVALAGYRLFQIVTPSGASVVLVTRRTFVSSGASLQARRLGEHVYWEKAAHG